MQIRRLGEQKRGENERLRRHLKRHVFVERRLRAIAEEMEAGMDCTECANCCRSATVRLKERDIPKLARFLRLKEQKFLDLYTEPSEEEGPIVYNTLEAWKAETKFFEKSAAK